MPWVDGYWKGPLRDGYPPTYFDESGRFSYPWENADNRQVEIESVPAQCLIQQEGEQKDES
jgi:hypothetical protein